VVFRGGSWVVFNGDAFAGASPRTPRGLFAPRPEPAQALDFWWKICAMRSSSNRPVRAGDGDADAASRGKRAVRRLGTSLRRRQIEFRQGGL